MSRKAVEQIINYHDNEAAFCRMVRLQSWGRSHSFKQMWARREGYHRRIIKTLRKENQ